MARLLRLRPRHGPRPTGTFQRDALEIPRWALLLAVLLTFLLFLSLLVLFFVPAHAREREAGRINFDRPAKDWYQGPVRYIITKQEVKAYKALESELDRQNFIDWFWQRRELVPSTPQNEFRDRFEQRVFEATRMFTETTKPGWKTDMGKIYILVGPPDEINRDIVAKTHRGIVTWVYRRPPFPDLGPNTVVAFARDVSGEFVVSASPTLDSDVARGLHYARVKRTADDRIFMPGRDPVLLDQGVPLSQSELGTLMIAGRLQQLPPHEEEMFKAFATTREFYGSIPADARLDFYRAADGTTYAAVTVGIKSTAVQYRSRGDREVPDVVVFGKLVSKDDPSLVYPLAGDTNFAESLENATAGPDDLLTFQATGGFKPGRYQLVLGVQDRVSKKIAAYRKDVEIPGFGAAALSLSSIALAGTMEPTDYQPSGGKPFYLGKFRVVPRPDNVFRKSDELNVYFQVYNAATDPAAGRPRLDIRYAFQSRAADGSFQELGAYEVKDSGAQAQGYAVPLERWPAGEYQVAVTVRDAVAGTSATSEAAFVIRE
ncbi:MAG: GWxTD domain-containing protein [Acidobacteria bacterium]|nr:GWxTD domain-containing protein [Acidobacteriota bacterium]